MKNILLIVKSIYLESNNNFSIDEVTWIFYDDYTYRCEHWDAFTGCHGWRINGGTLEWNAPERNIPWGTWENVEKGNEINGLLKIALFEKEVLT